MSLTATISTSAPDSCAARKTLRPMRPKPLIPTRTGMAGEPFPLAEDRPGRIEGEARLRPDTDVRHGHQTAVRTTDGALHTAVRTSGGGIYSARAGARST